MDGDFEHMSNQALADVFEHQCSSACAQEMLKRFRRLISFELNNFSPEFLPAFLRRQAD